MLPLRKYVKSWLVRACIFGAPHAPSRPEKSDGNVMCHYMQQTIVNSCEPKEQGCHFVNFHCHTVFPLLYLTVLLLLVARDILAFTHPNADPFRAFRLPAC